MLVAGGEKEGLESFKSMVSGIFKVLPPQLIRTCYFGAMHPMCFEYAVELACTDSCTTRRSMR